MEQVTSGRVREWFERAVTLVLALATGAVVWSFFFRTSAIVHPPPPRPEPVLLAAAAVKGSPTAPVGIILFSDFQCPSCQRFAHTILPSLLTTYVNTGKVLFAFKHLPVDTVHPLARGAAMSAICSAQESRFWEVHDAFFVEPAPASVDEYRARTLRAGVSSTGLDRCFGDSASIHQLQADVNEATRLRLQGTPALVVGRLRDNRVSVEDVIVGVRPIRELERIIEQLLLTR
jgi:protein-disulfide isomerase